MALSARAPVSARAPEAVALREEFEAGQAVVLRGFLPDEAGRWIAGELERATFRSHTIEATGKTELLMEPNRASALLLMLVNDPGLFQLVEALAGCEPIGSFRSRTYRMLPHAGHVSPWHNDALPGRLAALTVNLSRRPYEGAALQIRDAASQEIVREIDDLGFGDAVLIGITRDREHRNSPLVGSEPKTSHAGFFYGGERSPLART